MLPNCFPQVFVPVHICGNSVGQFSVYPQICQQLVLLYVVFWPYLMGVKWYLILVGTCHGLVTCSLAKGACCLQVLAIADTVIIDIYVQVFVGTWVFLSLGRYPGVILLDLRVNVCFNFMKSGKTFRTKLLCHSVCPSSVSVPVALCPYQHLVWS